MTNDSDQEEMEAWLSPIQGKIRALRKDLNQNDAEIDAIQIALQKAERPWYRDLPIIISICAFLFSLLTTTFSYYVARQQEIHNNQAELRNLIQRITALNSEYNELLNKPTAQNVGFRSDTVLTELILLSNQAYKLIERIPPGLVSAIEYYSLAPAFTNTLNPEQAEEMYLKAIDASQTRREKVLALRAYAIFLMLNQQPQKGRDVFASALSVSKASSSTYPESVMRDDILTYLDWSASELVQGQCSAARDELSKASALVSQLHLSTTDSLSIQLTNISKSLDTCK